MHVSLLALQAQRGELCLHRVIIFSCNQFIYHISVSMQEVINFDDAQQ